MLICRNNLIICTNIKMTEAISMHRFTFDECIFADNTDPVIVYMVVLILLPD